MEGKGNAGGWIDSLKAIIEANPVSEVDAGVRFCHRRVACQKPKMPQNASVLSIPFRFYKKLKLHSERKTFAFLSPALPVTCTVTAAARSSDRHIPLLPRRCCSCTIPGCYAVPARSWEKCPAPGGSSVYFCLICSFVWNFEFLPKFEKKGRFTYSLPRNPISSTYTAVNSLVLRAWPSLQGPWRLGYVRRTWTSECATAAA